MLKRSDNIDKDVIIESNIKILANVKITAEYYSKPGVWALYGRKECDDWRCLEVGKTVDIFDEIQSAIYILTTPDDPKCEKCGELYPARQRFGEESAEFLVHKCKKCPYVTDLRIKSWKRNPRYIDKYKDMLKQNYIDFKFVCIDMSEDMYDDSRRKAVEKEYATDKKALYWCG